MKRAKIVFIGAGSMSFGIPTFKDIFTAEELKGSEFVLVDIDSDNLERMYLLALKMNEASGMQLKISKTDDRRKALPGADFVINSLAIERCELWKHDFKVPIKYGIKHCLGENGGPGALFFGMRTIPLIMDICKDIEELCPNAWFLNFSNPESRIVLAVNKYTNVKCIGLCHGIFMAKWDIATILNKPQGEIEVTGAGMNHFQWVLSVRDKENGEDLYPVLIQKEKKFDPSFRPFTRKMFRAIGLWPTCSDDHLGEYLPYGYEAGMEGYNFDWDEQERQTMKQDIKDMTEGKRDIHEWLVPSGEQAIEVVKALYTGKRTYIPSAVVYNESAISNLPPDVAVEVPIVVEKDTIFKVHIGEIRQSIRSLLFLQVGAQQMAVDAAIYGDKEMAYQALLADPVINSTEAAKKILDELWEINKSYIKKSSYVK